MPIPLHPYRFGKNPFRGKEKPADYRPPLKAIRYECLACSGSREQVRQCSCTGCALWPLRFGKPAQVSEARRAAGRKMALIQFKREFDGIQTAKV